MPWDLELLLQNLLNDLSLSMYYHNEENAEVASNTESKKKQYIEDMSIWTNELS